MKRRWTTLAMLAALFCPVSIQVAAQEAQLEAQDLVVLPKSWDLESEQSFRELSDAIEANTSFAVKLDASEIVVDSQLGQPDQFVAALVVPKQALLDLENRVTQKYISARQSRPSFLKSLEDKIAGLEVRTFAFKMSDLGNAPLRPNVDPSFEMLNGSESTTLGQRSKIAGALMAANLSGLDVRLDDLSILPDQFRSSAPTQFEKQYDTTINSYLDAILNPGAAQKKSFETNARLTYDEFVRAWPSLSKNAPARASAVRRLRALNQQSSLKALYGVDSIFEPTDYEAIFWQSRRVVGVGPASGAHCSGLLIDSRWVLTAGHCLTNLTWSDVRIFVDKAQDENGPASRNNPLKVEDRWPPSGTGEASSDPIDYALLRVDGMSLAQKPMVATWLEKVEKNAPYCGREDPAVYREPVVVIGRQRSNPARIYDHAYVWFPFRLSAKQFEVLSADTGLGLQWFVQSWFDEKDWDREFRARYGQFESAYTAAEDGSIREFRMNRQRRQGGTGAEELKRPYLGFDTDTVKGNSGSPIYSRADNCLVGVFAGGLLDGSEFENSSWSRHEFGTPLSTIVDHLDKVGSAVGEASQNVADARAEVRQKLINR